LLFPDDPARIATHLAGYRSRPRAPPLA
jgi:hypothetical protein